MKESWSPGELGMIYLGLGVLEFWKKGFRVRVQGSENEISGFVLDRGQGSGVSGVGCLRGLGGSGVRGSG